MNKLILLVSCLASAATSTLNARASELPATLPYYYYEADTLCNPIHSVRAYRACIREEQLGYNALRPIWASVPPQIQLSCDQATRANGIGSYAILNTCVAKAMGTKPVIPQALAIGANPESKQPMGDGPVTVAALPVAPTVETSVWKGEFGGRYWYSSGTTQYDLYRRPPTSLISRLTYTGLTGHAGELFGRVDHWSGVFVKGYAGIGSIPNGNLQDEDFPLFFPLFLPQIYSSTNSAQQSGNLGYLAADVGWAFWQPFSPTSGNKAGIFAGYFYYGETVNAYGCTQTAGNPAFCVPSIPLSVLGITEKTRWNALRVGFNDVWKINERLKLTGDVAWIPYASLSASDTHWLRLGFDLNGPTPQDGSGHGVQLEGTVSYNITDAFAVGAGARYWLIQTSNGGATQHFEQSGIPPGFPQALTFKTERYGGFVQASYTFGSPHGP